jgi:hypothetical protein
MRITGNPVIRFFRIFNKNQMKTKILAIWLLITVITACASYSQTDSVRSFYINKTKVFPGKYYQFDFFGSQPAAGKLTAVDTARNSILVYYDNSLTEYNISEIISVKEIDSQNYAFIYESYHKKPDKTRWSLSAGYSSVKRSYYYYYYDDARSDKGFNLTGDMAVKFSDNFGFRSDVNIIHAFGNTVYEQYSSGKTEYGDNNTIGLMISFLTGYLRDKSDFNFYINIGFGMIYTFSYENTEYYDDYYYGTQIYTYDAGDMMELGFYGSMRFSYRITNKHLLFIEPAIHWWSGNTDRITNLNGGITFLL